jgi:adenylate kinase family enzyme
MRDRLKGKEKALTRTYVWVNLFRYLENFMKKIAIIGPAGAGKSTLAREIGDITQIEVVHLDMLFWKPGWVEMSREAWISTQQELVQGKEWIIDGHFQSTIDIRLNAAGCVIFLDMSRLLCLWRVIKRHVMYFKRSRPDLPKECPEKITWQYLVKIWNFPKKERAILIEKLRRISDEKQIIWLTSPRDVYRFLNVLKATYKKTSEVSDKLINSINF